MSKRLIVIPRWGGTPESDWYPWLQDELRGVQSRPFDPIHVVDMPNPSVPVVETWVRQVAHVVGSDREELAHTVIMAHSVGNHAVLRHLASLPVGVGVAGVFFVAGWWAVDEPWDTLLPWMDISFDLERAKSNAGKMVVAISDNDPLTHDWRNTRRLWQQRMGAEVMLVPGAAHFNGQRYPALLQALNDHFAN